MFSMSFILAFGLLASSAQAQFLTCADFRGLAVAAVDDPNLPNVAAATYGPMGEPIVLVNPWVLGWFQPQTRLFWLAHECGHHALAHAVRQIPLAQEQEADCFAIQALVTLGGFTAFDVATVQSDLAKIDGSDWQHLPGPQRAINLDRCLAWAPASLAPPPPTWAPPPDDPDDIFLP